MLDTTMEVDHSSSDDWSSSEMKMGVGSAISKKGGTAASIHDTLHDIIYISVKVPKGLLQHPKGNVCACVQIMSAQNNPCVYLDSTSKTKVATETPKKKGATLPGSY